MTTSEPTNQNHIQHELSLGVFRAKTFQTAAEAKASRRLQGLVYSTTSCESYAWFDQTSSSWKTWQRSLITGWTPYLESFTRQGLMQNGQLFQQQWLELVTSETGGGLLPTPLASDPERKAKFKQGGTPLMGALLPTPTVCNDSIYYDNSPNKDKRHSKGLATHVADQLPTPRASEWKGVGQVGSKSSLDWEKKGYLSGVMNETCSPQTGEATHLNPSFVEEMMGYPVGWSDFGR